MDLRRKYILTVYAYSHLSAAEEGALYSRKTEGEVFIRVVVFPGGTAFPLDSTAMKTTLSLLFCLLVGVYSQSETNATTSSTLINGTTSTTHGAAAYIPDCSLRNPTCNGRGVCMKDGACRCWYGFFGYSPSMGGLSWSFGGTVDNCLLSTTQLGSKYSNQLSELRTYQGVIFGVLALLMIYRVILEFCLSSSRASGAVITKYSMVLLLFLCLWQAIQSGDFFGNFGHFNIKGYYVLYYFKDNLLLFVFSALLFHWAELYHAAIRKMKREEMLQKIKPGYEPNLAMEDILLKISLVSRFRFGYIIVCIISLLAYIGIVLVELTATRQSIWQTYIVFYFSFYTVVWILFCAGYMYYGLRLLQIIPDVMQGRIKAVMILMGLFSIIGVANACLNIAIQAEPGTTTINLGSLYAIYTLIWLMTFLSVNVFIPIWEWHRSITSETMNIMYHPRGSEECWKKHSLETHVE
ncbi:hypothetical protein PROFUN_02248 [Planoprotostelium fungivorum]|uniref:Uncharacterized protein n=1 Tax=Planoprotostelium fungivorum TaxID=1890364 RepID=A0A2P6NYE2_9EUKA|nr:hypothetical protein PROFUN_02248 [Planoprotostelium fungivorum]